MNAKIIFILLFFFSSLIIPLEEGSRSGIFRIEILSLFILKAVLIDNLFWLTREAGEELRPVQPRIQELEDGRRPFWR